MNPLRLIFVFLPLLVVPSISLSQEVDSLATENLDEDSKWVYAIEPVPLNIREVSQSIGYPAEMYDLGIEGTVIIRLLVDSLGNYEKHKLTQGVHPVLDQAVENQVAKIKFKPASLDGESIKFWVNFPFKFRLTAETGGNEKEDKLYKKNISKLSALKYPEDLLKDEVEGPMIIRILTDEAGKYEGHTVEVCPDSRLEAFANSRLSKLKFSTGDGNDVIHTLNLYFSVSEEGMGRVRVVLY